MLQNFRIVDCTDGMNDELKLIKTELINNYTFLRFLALIVFNGFFINGEEENEFQ